VERREGKEKYQELMERKSDAHIDTREAPSSGLKSLKASPTEGTVPGTKKGPQRPAMARKRKPRFFMETKKGATTKGKKGSKTETGQSRQKKKRRRKAWGL